MPIVFGKASRRARRMHHCGRFYMDRRICPNCGATVYLFSRHVSQTCRTCKHNFVWKSEPEVVPAKPPPPRPLGRKLVRVLSDIEDGDESDESDKSDKSDDESLRPRNSITTDGGSFRSRLNSTTESRDDSVVGPLNDEAPYNSESGQADDTQRPATPPPSLDSNSAVRNSRRIPFITRPLSHIHVPRRFRRPTNRFRKEPMAPNPSVITAHAIKRVPYRVMVKQAFSLNFLLEARARDPPRHGGSLRHPSPVIEPRDPDGVILQHCADLHHALLPLEGWEREEEVVEESGAAEERGREPDEEIESLSSFRPDALSPIIEGDEVGLLQPERSGADDSNEDGEVAICGEEESLRDLMREFSCYTFMRNVGAGLKNKVRKWRR